jgi:hypothetical protein
MFQDAVHRAPHVAADVCRGIVIEIDLSFETDEVSQEFQVLDFHIHILSCSCL